MLARYALLVVALASHRNCLSPPPLPAKPVASSSAGAVTAVPTAAASPPYASPPRPEMPIVDRSPLIEAKHVATRGAKPPLKFLRFDVVLRNDRDAPRWFLLPYTIEDSRWLGPVSHLQRTELVGEGKVLIGRAQYFGGSFHVVRLAAHGKVTIRGLHYASWAEQLPPTVLLDVVTATDVRFGDESIDSWFQVDPTASPNADVEDDRNMIGQRELPAHDTEGNREVPVHVTEDRRLRLRVAIDPAAWRR